ncbi:TetR/AcrR family transcriptional regulator [Gracilibacillus saliphilus]|uniref:TetR/AcrR family transcriptional regulator n=1 Tax=Gracilibacillus saliphilus TaxID=543890 RepID=UPI0013D42DB0|nr:TetR/AcrR family transcriptional regulator [Gracilibacillus saliphilus]
MKKKKRISCREEMLQVTRQLMKEKGKNEFSVQEVLDEMKKAGTTYKDSTVRTHLTSKCCVGTKPHHQTVYDDYQRIERGLYSLTKSL